MFPLNNGDAAPDFELTDVFDKQWKLSDHKGKMVFLYFGRGEYCPTTRGEFANFDSFAHLFSKMNCEMVFLMNGGRKEHRAIAEALRMRPRILVDDDGTVGETYGIYGVNHNDTKRDDYKNYIAPSAYLINADGTVAGCWRSSLPRGLPTAETLLGILVYAQHNDWKY
jgi:peroxiredoxin Q/BCP